MSEARPSDRRRSPRVPLGVRVAGGPSQGEGALALGYAADVSVHGIYLDLKLTTEEAGNISINRSVNLRFRPPNTDRPVEVVGLIRRIVRNSSQEPIGIGVEFIEFGRDARAILEQYVISQLKDQDPMDADPHEDPTV